MEKKERYENRDGIYDTAINDYVYTDDIVDLLNQQDKEIKQVKENLSKFGNIISEQDRKIKELEQENLSLQEDSIRENQINVIETVELEKDINKLKEENIKLKKQQLYFDLMLTRLQWLHKKANEYKEDKERFGLEDYLPLDSVWRVLDLQKNQCCKYEEMSELEEGIETIAQEELLREIEHNLNFKPTKTEDEIFKEIQKIDNQIKE